eukprot:Sspe_Gene.75154::Locus_46965_Transcript_1_1_Confidence_1.000_Length_1144::g.75154::m.75154/K15119/SLC25A39_40; solute carrier family 25, member 39/40
MSDNGGRNELTLIHRMASACVGSALVALTMTPLDVAKVKLQAQTPPAVTCRSGVSVNVHAKCMDLLFSNGLMEHRFFKSGWPCYKNSCSTCGPQTKQRYRGTFDVLRHTVRTEGVTGLYAGVTPTLFMAVPANVMYFAAYEGGRDALHPYIGDLAPIVSGGVARTFATSSVAPLEYLRTRMQASGNQSEHLKQSIQSRGVRVLWTGTVPTLWRDVPFSAFYWAGYERARKDLSTVINFPPLRSFVSGAISGATAAALTMPFDVVKTRVQVEMSIGEKSQPRLWQTLQTIYKEEGAKALMAGTLPRMSRAGSGCSIMIGSYESAKWLLLNMPDPAHLALDKKLTA